jgi:hypothetical protein
MALVLDGIEYDNAEAFDVAVDMANFINDYCARNDVRNSKNELMRIDVNNASVAWLVLFALGYRESLLERLLYALGCNFNISLCSDEQLLNLAQIARVQRKQPAPSTIVVTVAALPSGPVNITKDVTATVAAPQGELVFAPSQELLVPQGAVRSLVFIANKNGAYTLPQNAITSFDVSLDNLDFVSSAPGAAGADWEPFPSLRQRLNVDNKSASDEDLATRAIAALPGVVSCNIFTNYNMDTDILINNVPVPPRKSIVYVNGFNDNISAEYFKYMTVLPVYAPVPNCFEQAYVTRSGQSVPFSFFAPEYVEIYARVVIDIQVISERIASIQNTLLKLNGTYDIGKNITAADILNQFRDKTTDFNVLGANLSMDGANWNIATTIGANQLFSISRDNISVTQWGAP